MADPGYRKNLKTVSFILKVDRCFQYFDIAVTIFNNDAIDLKFCDFPHKKGHKTGSFMLFYLPTVCMYTNHIFGNGCVANIFWGKMKREKREKTSDFRE